MAKVCSYQNASAEQFLRVLSFLTAQTRELTPGRMHEEKEEEEEEEEEAGVSS